MWKFIFKSSKLPPSYGTTCICAIMGEKKAHRWWPKFRSDGHLHNLSPSPSLHGPNAVGCLLVTLLECNYVIFRIQINHSRMPTTVVMLSSTCVCVCTCTRAECADDKTRPGWHPSVGSFFLVTSTITPRHCSGGHIPRGTKCENVRVHLSTWKWQTFVQPAPLEHVECGWEMGEGAGERRGLWKQLLLTSILYVTSNAFGSFQKSSKFWNGGMLALHVAITGEKVLQRCSSAQL